MFLLPFVIPQALRLTLLAESIVYVGSSSSLFKSNLKTLCWVTFAIQLFSLRSIAASMHGTFARRGQKYKDNALISFSAAQAIVAQLLSSTTEPMSPADPETIVTSLVGIFVVENYFGYLPSPRDYSGLEDDTLRTL